MKKILNYLLVITIVSAFGVCLFVDLFISPAKPAEQYTCLLIGDSITSEQGLGREFPECFDDAVIGIGSAAVAHLAELLPKKTWDFIIISAGSNDPTNLLLRSNLESIRSRLKAFRYVWIVPTSITAGVVVHGEASEHGDSAVSFAGKLHPYSYQRLAADIRKALK